MHGRAITGTGWHDIDCAFCDRALQLHPNVPALYILGAAQELENQSPTAARTLLQRGLRLNKESAELWTEYVRMELGYAETVRRRWSVLGIEATAEQREIIEGAVAAAAARHAAETGGAAAVDGITAMVEAEWAGTAAGRRVTGAGTAGASGCESRARGCD